MQGSLKLGTLAGIDIRVHYTWLFAFVLIAWSLALGYFPTAGMPEQDQERVRAACSSALCSSTARPFAGHGRAR